MAVVLVAGAGQAGEVEQGLSEFRQGSFAEAFQSWRRAAEAGDARGALYLGVLYDTGLGVAADREETLAWYRRAAEGGSAAGAFNVGVIYDSGLGVGANAQEAAAWYARSASAGYGRAEYNLGMLYETGTGVPQSREKAVALFQNAARHGISAARLHLAGLGQPVVRHAEIAPPDASMRAFQQAQEVFLKRGPAEAARAVALFKQAADLHNPLAEYDLGYCYERGLGVPRDLVQAYSWYRRSVADTSDDALRSIATLGARTLEAQMNRSQLAQIGARPR